MSLIEYQRGRALAERDEPFYALIQAAMRRADSTNHEKLRVAFPDVHQELTERYNAAGGLLDGERETAA